MSLKSFFKNLFGFGQRVEVIRDTNDSRDNKLDNLFSERENNILKSLRELSSDRLAKIADYRQMLIDGVTLSAVELISEDASLIDDDTGLAAWVESADNPDFAALATDFLRNKLRINDIIYPLAFNIVAFGECFLDTNYSNIEYRKEYNVGDYFTIAEPEDIVHIYRYGVPLGYLFKSASQNGSTISDTDKLLPERAYIHFISDRANKEYLTNDAYIQYGASFLEGARTYYKQRQLLDDLLILARLTRSSFYRLFSVDVGAASSQDTARMMRELKTAVSSKQSINVSTEVFSSRTSPILTGGNVYFPTRNGQGAVTVQEVGGEVNVSALADIDYFDDRYYGALKVPKQFLGQSDEMPGGIGDTTLTQLDIRYARTVKRCQRIIKSGLKDLIYWYCSIHNILPPSFTIEMPKILTAEDTRLSDIQKAKIETTNSILDLVKAVDEDIIEKSDKAKLIASLLNNVSNDEDILDALNLEQFNPVENESSDNASSNNEKDNTSSNDEEQSDDMSEFGF
jgi:hypothetical protein